MNTLKSIDGKSLLIGALMASTIFFATGATRPTDVWDNQQEWLTISSGDLRGCEDIVVGGVRSPITKVTAQRKLAGGRGFAPITKEDVLVGWQPTGSSWRKRIR